MSTPPAAPYDAIAEFYDEDMGVNNPGIDISFYRKLAARAGGRVLELGCGTGRITIPLLGDGHRVDGVDCSGAMLDRLKQKAAGAARGQLRLHCLDMSRFEFGGEYACVICPFSAFTYVVDSEDRRHLLDAIRQGVARDGVFALDVFIPKHDVLLRPDDHVYRDYRRRRPDGTFLERERTIAKDLPRQTDQVTRTYRVVSEDGAILRTVVARTRVKYYFHGELRLLLENYGFEIVEEGTDFVAPYRYEGTSMYFVCRKA